MDPEIEAVADGEQVEEVEQDDPSQTDQAAAGDQADASGDGGAGDDDEITVTIGDEDPPAEDSEAAPAWVRTLRKDHQKVLREARELRAENEKLKGAAAPAAIVVGEEPTLEAYEYDEGRFKQAWRDWNARKAQAESQQREQAKAKEDDDKAWNTRLAAYGTAKAALKVKDFDEAEAAVLSVFNVTQQGIVLHSKQPEVMVYALGKSDKARAELAAIKNPVEFALAIGRLESKLKVTPRKSVPPPERRFSGGAPGKAGTAGSDAKLAALEAEADKTGDRTKVAAYHRQQKLQQQQKRAA